MTRFQGDFNSSDIAIEMRDRAFPGVFVRQLCDRVYGGRISTEAWKNWRKWANVKPSKRSYSFKELCTLYAIATIRSNEDDRYRQLRRSEIDAIANCLDTHELLAELIRFFDSRYVIGKDAPTRLAMSGIKTSLKSLYRNVPNFSTGEVYRVDELQFWTIA